MSDAAPTDPAFPVTERSRVRRVHERGSHERAAVHAVLDAAMLCHVAYVLDGQPYCTPTIHWRDGDVLYWHGSSASRMLRHLAEGVPACLTASHLDGLVLARSAFNHSVNYRSAMCFGTARIVDDPTEKARALDALVDRFYPGRAATLRPTSAKELKATMVIAMTIDEASAKVRAKGVADDEEDLGHPVWAGVVPLRTVIEADRPCPHVPEGMVRSEALAAYRPGRTLDEAFAETQAIWESLTPDA
jgi:uncharacterized protein